MGYLDRDRYVIGIGIHENFINLLWKAKVDKIKRSVITQHYFSRGMAMVDITNFIISLKCSWMKRLTKSY